MVSMGDGAGDQSGMSRANGWMKRNFQGAKRIFRQKNAPSLVFAKQLIHIALAEGLVSLGVVQTESAETV